MKSNLTTHPEHCGIKVQSLEVSHHEKSKVDILSAGGLKTLVNADLVWRGQKGGGGGTSEGSLGEDAQRLGVTHNQTSTLRMLGILK